MRPAPIVPLALLALLVAAPARGLAGQERGKIDDVEHSAENAKGHDDHHHDDADEGGGFFFFLLRGVFHTFGHHAREAPPLDSAAVEPEPLPPGQGYLAYPYAEHDAPSSFVLRGVREGPGFANVSLSYFADDQSSLRALHIGYEGAWRQALLTAEGSYYREPTAGETDYLVLGHVALSGIGPIGDVGYFKAGLAVQGVLTDRGDAAGGPGLDLGVQLFPGRPLGLGVTGRVAALTWRGGPLFGTGFVDAMGTGSALLGRVELQVGYRWTRVGVGAPFRGPTVGMRVWF